ncbi:hypothetical protein E3N88_28192 [Mikania micrantha]|uniref:Uncharacterized protein n=1 Tax=Mikania micrantha TaxID=192012 RepID=A0A5N6MZD9_9ASTR|nr:hypothetical protein E3N88_28192 [Mikania micrantha]
MLFVFTIVTLLICSSSSYADDHLPQPRFEDSELRFLTNPPQFLTKFLGYLERLKALGRRNAEGFKVGVERAKQIYEVTAQCSKKYKCNEANPLCGGYCVYKLGASTGKFEGCTKHCGVPKEKCYFVPPRGVKCTKI